MTTEIFKNVSKKLGLNPFSQITENQHMLTVVSKEKNLQAEDREEIVHISFDNQFVYRFKSSDKNTLLKIIEIFEKNTLLSYSIDAYE